MIKNEVTIKDIAREAGVSSALVSYALNNHVDATGAKRYKVNEETEKRIKEIAARKGYKPNNIARSLRSRKSRMIGAILSDISNPFFSEIARSLEDIAYEYGYSLLLGSTDENADKLNRILETFAAEGTDGLIIVPCENSASSIKRVYDKGIPMVLLDRDVPEIDTSKVILDNEKAGRMAVSALCEGGFRHVEMISYSNVISNTHQREFGYIKEMQERGYGEFARVHHVDYYNLASQMKASIEEALGDGADSLVFATNSLAVIGLKELMKRGVSIPKDLGMVAFDGGEAFDLYYQPITYISQPLSQFAQNAFNLLLDKMGETPADNTTIVLSPQLVPGVTSRR